jgi:hypothetical protein
MRLAKVSLYLTGALAAFFTCMQLYKYSVSLISISDSIYGTVFSLSTGFHGIHVTIEGCSIGYYPPSQGEAIRDVSPPTGVGGMKKILSKHRSKKNTF